MPQKKTNPAALGACGARKLITAAIGFENNPPAPNIQSGFGTFTREFVRELRKENKSWRERFQAERHAHALTAAALAEEKSENARLRSLQHKTAPTASAASLPSFVTRKAKGGAP